MLQIHPIPAFENNYFWLIQPDTNNNSVYVVDPGAAEPVLKVLTEKKLALRGILITHHHHDHIGGASALQAQFNIPVFGPVSAYIPQVTHPVSEGDSVSLDNLHCRVLALPGHTLDHIAYYIEPPANTKPPEKIPRLFSGDTLFAAGCGRLFDGTAPLLFSALEKISQLANETLIYAAHEYTLANIEFALYLEPHNQAVIERQTIEIQKRQAGLPTLPTQLALEKNTNPFLRCHLPAIKERTEQITGTQLPTPVDIFAALRRLKDTF